MSNAYYIEHILPLIASSNNLEIIDFLERQNLLASQVWCEACNELMSFAKYGKTKDGYSWRCQTRTCQKFKLTTTIRAGSIFENSNLTLQKFLHVLYLWCIQESQQNAADLTGVDRRAVGNIFTSIRACIAAYFKKNPVQLGGPGVIVQIDESAFGHKQKYHRGRMPKSNLWVFGLVDTSTRPATGYMQIVDQRDSATLLPIIQRVVRLGSIVHSDEWRAYRGIQARLGLEHHTVNHSVEFVASDGTHTQHIILLEPGKASY